MALASSTVRTEAKVEKSQGEDLLQPSLLDLIPNLIDAANAYSFHDVSLLLCTTRGWKLEMTGTVELHAIDWFWYRVWSVEVDEGTSLEDSLSVQPGIALHRENRYTYQGLKGFCSDRGHCRSWCTWKMISDL